MQAIYLALKREQFDSKEPAEWLIANGSNIGRWTRSFGVNCMADSYDCQQTLKSIEDSFHGTFYKFTVCQCRVELPDGIQPNETAFCDLI